MNQLDISNKILQWVQGLKLLAPGAVVFVVWAFKSSPGLWATRAVNPWTWMKKWEEAKRPRKKPRASRT